MAMNKFATVISALSLVLLNACGGPEEEAPAVEESAPEAPVAATPAELEPSGLPRSEAIDGASVFFITPEDGATVSSPVDIEFGIDRMSLVPAGVNEKYSGHHHLLIDTELPALDRPIPADSNHIHFGDGSTSTQVELPPGEHTLLLLLGDHLHIPHDPPVASQTITITVE
jgi:hypothetical protein